MSEKRQDLSPLSTLPEAERAEAMKRFGLIQACVEDGALQAEVARQHGIPLRTVQR